LIHCSIITNDNGNGFGSIEMCTVTKQPMKSRSIGSSNDQYANTMPYIELSKNRQTVFIINNMCLLVYIRVCECMPLIINIIILYSTLIINDSYSVSIEKM